jgi:hypothetical protein
MIMASSIVREVSIEFSKLFAVAALSLESVSLTHCKIVGFILPPTVRKLDVSVCFNVNDRGTTPICIYLIYVGLLVLSGRCINLTSLRLNYAINMTDVGLQTLKSLTKLEDLQINYCDKITMAGLDPCLGPNLKNLEIAGCNITEVEIRTILKVTRW